MSWAKEWAKKGRIRLPEKYNSVVDIKRELRKQLGADDIRRAAKYANRFVDLPGMTEAQEEELILTILSYGLYQLTR